MGEPCKFAELSLTFNPFNDITYRLGESSIQNIFSLDSIADLDDSLLSSSSCGDFGIEFKSNAGEELDNILFFSWNQGQSASFEVKENLEETLVGEYDISYKVFLVDYPDRFVDSRESFKLKVIDPCVETTTNNPRPSRCPVEEIEYEELDEGIPDWLQEL